MLPSCVGASFGLGDRFGFGVGLGAAFLWVGAAVGLDVGDGLADADVTAADGALAVAVDPAAAFVSVAEQPPRTAVTAARVTDMTIRFTIPP